MDLALSDMFDVDGTALPQPVEFWRAVPLQFRQAFGHIHALYSFPTIEAVQLLREMLPPDTIEIVAGNGGWCKALEITGTDSYQQEKPKYKALYAAAGQPTIHYGAHVVEMDALHAVKKHRPRAVLASWVTHQYEMRRHHLGGNEAGVDEHALLKLVDEYWFIGNTKVHANKPLFADLKNGNIRTHEIAGIWKDGVASRASGGEDFIMQIRRK